MDRWAGKIAAIACLSMGQVDDVAAATVPRHFSHISCASRISAPCTQQAPMRLRHAKCALVSALGLGLDKGQKEEVEEVEKVEELP